MGISWGKINQWQKIKFLENGNMFFTKCLVLVVLSMVVPGFLFPKMPNVQKFAMLKSSCLSIENHVLVS